MSIFLSVDFYSKPLLKFLHGIRCPRNYITKIIHTIKLFGCMNQTVEKKFGWPENLFIGCIASDVFLDNQVFDSTTAKFFLCKIFEVLCTFWHVFVISFWFIEVFLVGNWKISVTKLHINQSKIKSYYILKYFLLKIKYSVFNLT